MPCGKPPAHGFLAGAGDRTRLESRSRRVSRAHHTKKLRETLGPAAGRSTETHSGPHTGLATSKKETRWHTCIFTHVRGHAYV